MYQAHLFVKAELTKKGISISEIARRAGEDVKETSRMLKKGVRTNRSEAVFQEVAKALGMPIGYIFALYTMNRNEAA